MIDDSKVRRLRRHGLLLAASAALVGTAVTAHAQELSKAVTDQIASLEDEKASRTPAQQKMDSQLIYAARMSRGLAVTSKVQTLDVTIPESGDGGVLVDITADVTPELLQQITDAGGTVQSSFPALRAIRASLPLDQIEGVAASSAVQTIRPADIAYTVGLRHKQFGFAGQTVQSVVPAPLVPQSKSAAPRLISHAKISKADIARLLSQVKATRRSAPSADTLGIPILGQLGFASHANLLLGSFLTPIVSLGADFTTNVILAPGSGSVDSEGDTAHRANLVRSTFGTTGAGLKIGVLSDSIDDTSGSFAAAVASGDVSPVTVLPGQAGTPGLNGAGEGLAMLEIVHDLAPDAQLYFATAFTSAASFATNIRDLRTAGCDIIIDDVAYFNEAVFQDGAIAQAVNDVTASGALYFSSAGNSDYLGSQAPNSSGVWEGNFFDSGVSVSTLKPTTYTKTGTFHNFAGVTGATGTQNPLYAFSSRPAYLFWSDPYGASSNDYDLFYTNAAGTSISSAGTNTQNGTQDPYESVTAATTGRRFLVVKAASAATRFLHLTLNRNLFYSSTLPYYATNGQTSGHASAVDAYCVAASPAVSPGPFPGTFSTTSPVEIFTSDGPRRIFYNANGTAITPGNFLATGGTVRLKPDVTAADGVTTTLPSTSGLNPFYGTSAAAPHAGAIAALLKSYNPALSTGQIRGLLTSTAIDIRAAGYDNVSGYGIVDPYTTIAAAPTPALLPITLSPDTVSGGVGSTGTITLRDPAPAGGAAIPLTVTGPASVPNSVTVPEGQKTATFPITTSVVTTSTFAVIKANYLGEIKSAFLDVLAQYNIGGRVTTTTGTGVPGVAINTIVQGVAGQTVKTNSTAVAIPDGGTLDGTAPGAAVTSAVTFTDSGNVAAIKVGVNISHTFQTDLELTLIAPNGNSVLLRAHAGSPGGTNLITSFPDQTTPANSLSTLFGQPVAGTWKLKVQDFYSGDTGTINSFTLTLDRTGPVAGTPAITDSNGYYAFANFAPGTYPLTPSKPGFNFAPVSRTVTVGPNATGQDFTLSQAGIRTSATVTKGADYAVTVTFANGGPDAAGAQVTKATLGSATPTSPAVPTSLGTIALGTSTSVTYHFPLSAGASGTNVGLKVSGTYTGGSFGGSLSLKLL